MPALQAVWNLRDAFKANKRTLVLLGPSLTLPPELSGEVIAYDEPLPDGERLRAIVTDVYRSARLDPPASDVEVRAVDALSGLSAFTAEQVTAMSLTPTGLDLDALWDRKRNAIEQTRGLSVYRGTETFADVEGCDAAKDELRRKIDGRLRPGAIVFIDEVEKALGGLGAAGGAGDSSGTTQDQLGQLLAYMQDRDVAGFLFLGHPGAAKSALAKAAGNEAGIPTIQFDLGGMKGSLVGESEARIREALKVVTAVSNGRPLIIATCNSVANLPPELMRRFTTTYFFDLPTAEERARIWALYRRKFELPAADPLPPDEGWTGAEIRRCAMKAWEYGLPLRQAATYVIPLARSAADRIERLRNEASGRYRSAYTGEPYRYAKDITPATSATVTGRAIEFEEA